VVGISPFKVAFSVTDEQADHPFRAFVFKNRGALLAIPAVWLALRGRPSAFSTALGLPIAFAGEFLRCWAVGYSGVTTRSDRVTAPEFVSNGPYAHLRNPLYVGNFLTALGFTIAFTGALPARSRASVMTLSLGFMAAVYSVIIPHEEAFLAKEFGEDFALYLERVPPIIPRLSSYSRAQGEFDPAVIGKAETRTWVTFGLMLAALALRARKAAR
jgi:protein-S-isoprenylcysteine O-methyltransferase Ste14